VAKPTKTVSCKCGQVLFDENCEPAETLTCPGCKQKYRYLGGDKVEPIGSKKAKPDSGAIEVMSVEVFKIDIPEKVDEKDFAGRLKAHSAKRAKPKPLLTEEELAAKKEKAAKGKPKEIPGGIVPMIGFIVAFNAIALTILAFVFPLNPDGSGSRDTPFGVTIPKMSVPWPTLVTLLLGHLFGFGAWIGYVYRLHKKKLDAGEDEEDTEASRVSARKKAESAQPARKKAARDDDDDDDEEIIDEDDEEALIRARTRKMPPVGPRRNSSDEDEDDDDDDDEPKRPSPRPKR
jgi:hypothetical protein